MKTQAEIVLKAKEYAESIGSKDGTCMYDYAMGYTQCQENMAYTKGCECESSIGQTWCCNQCGLPYDTRKSDNKYTEEDMYNCWQTAFTDAMNIREKDYKPIWFSDFINSLNKQD